MSDATPEPSSGQSGRADWAADWIATANRLRTARTRLRLRQSDVAARLGISTRHFARIESGETDPTARVLFAWADAVGYRLRLADLSGARA